MVFCDFLGVRRIFRWVMTVFWSCGGSRGAGVFFGGCGDFFGVAARVARVRRRVLAIRQAGDVLMGGASGASCLLLNTKASQEAACSRAPAAIVPGPEPESRDAGVSRFRRIGSHLTETDAAEGLAGQVEGLGSSRNAGTGSHLEATDAAESYAGQVGSLGSSRSAGNGSHLEAADFSDEPWVVM